MNSPQLVHFIENGAIKRTVCSLLPALGSFFCRLMCDGSKSARQMVRTEITMEEEYQGRGAYPVGSTSEAPFFPTY
jgi:hypothetical protein